MLAWDTPDEGNDWSRIAPLGGKEYASNAGRRCDETRSTRVLTVRQHGQLSWTLRECYASDRQGVIAVHCRSSAAGAGAAARESRARCKRALARPSTTVAGAVHARSGKVW